MTAKRSFAPRRAFRFALPLALACAGAGLGPSCFYAADIFPWAPPDTPAAECPMPTLDLLFPFSTPQSPGEAFPDAPPCARNPHDVIIVLGCPSDEDGQPSDCQRQRVERAVALQKAGYSDRFIVTGGAVHNAFNESEALAALLEADGVTEDRIFREPLAEHTDENVYYSTQIMKQQGWESALVVSTSSHLLYTAVCDADCCVRLGRLSLLTFPVAGSAVAAGHYALTPPADPVSDVECDHLKNPSKAMCVQLPKRRACRDHFELPPP